MTLHTKMLHLRSYGYTNPMPTKCWQSPTVSNLCFYPNIFIAFTYCITKRSLFKLQDGPTSPERGTPAPYFYRGAMIRLEDGSFRRVEEMRTEDFVNSASRSNDLALTKCTLLRLNERGDQLALTLTYDRNRTQVRNTKRFSCL